MKSPSRLPQGVEGASSRPSEELHNLIAPEHEVDSFRETAKAVGKMLHAQAVHNIEMANRRYFGEVGKERSRRTMIYSHNWSIAKGLSPQTRLIAQDAALLAENCAVPLQFTAADPQHGPMFHPYFISFNGRGDSCDDFQYPPHLAANREIGLFGRIHCKCKTECRDYDTLVSAILLSIKHHLGSKCSVRSTGQPDGAGWTAAFELYARTFPERELPWLANWPKRPPQNG